MGGSGARAGVVLGLQGGVTDQGLVDDRPLVAEDEPHRLASGDRQGARPVGVVRHRHVDRPAHRRWPVEGGRDKGGPAEQDDRGHPGQRDPPAELGPRPGG